MPNSDPRFWKSSRSSEERVRVEDFAHLSRAPSSTPPPRLLGRRCCCRRRRRRSPSSTCRCTRAPCSTAARSGIGCGSPCESGRDTRSSAKLQKCSDNEDSPTPEKVLILESWILFRMPAEGRRSGKCFKFFNLAEGEGKKAALKDRRRLQK